MNKQRSFVDRCIKDGNNRVTVLQAPNLPIIVAGLAWLLTKVLPYGQANFAAELVYYGALFTWAWMELFQGVNYARRLLGLVVLVALIMSRL